MWAVKKAVHELEAHGIVVHLLKKVLDEVGMIIELVGSYPLHVFLIVALFVKEQAAEVLC